MSTTLVERSHGVDLTSRVVIVRRVVEMRRNQAQGIRPSNTLPSSTARTQPLEPLPPSEEKDELPRRKKKWWQKLLCC